MRIVVTGACGFIGSLLVEALLKGEHEVVAFDNLLYGGHPPLIDLAYHPRLTFVRGDVRDRALLAKVARGADVVVHLAAIVGAPACRRDPELSAAVNVGGTANVVAAVREGAPEAHLIFASTDSCYGQTLVSGACTESSTLCPLSEYARDKESAERIVRGAPRWTIARFATAFGLGRRLRLDLMVNDFTWQAVHNKHLIVYESDFARTFLHVRDIVGAVLRVLERPAEVMGQVYNVGDDRLNATKADIARLVAEVVPGTTLNLLGEGTDPDGRNYTVDHAAIRALGFEAAITLKAGIAELAKGYAMCDVRSPWRNV